jgi:RNA-directed DNA polymerase
VVDIDLEKFFDRVDHQRLIARLARRVSDRRLLVLIARMLKAKVVLPDGVVIGVDEGVPQGSPLSPLLSNIVLDGSTASSPGVATGSSATPMTATSTCEANAPARGSWPA